MTKTPVGMLKALAAGEGNPLILIEYTYHTASKEARRGQESGMENMKR
jgi:hypothetical protein